MLVEKTAGETGVETLYGLESRLQNYIRGIATASDPAHDFLHFERVVQTARQLCYQERARAEIVIPAAWLHDCVNVPKNDPRRKEASRLSAREAVRLLNDWGVATELHAPIAHAIEAHSFSAGISPQTLEAQIVQDADRLDGLGAIGIARCFTTAGILGRPLYSEQDPLCESRTPDDTVFTVDHFFTKLFKTANTLQTQSARKEGQRRVLFMQTYLQHLLQEIQPHSRTQRL